MTSPRYLNVNQSLQAAAQQIAAGKLDYAKGVVKQVLAGDPNNVDALHLMSMIHYQEGRLAAAINCSKQAVDIMPDSVALLNNLGTLLKTAGDLRAAQFYYGKAIEADRLCFPAYYNLAAVLAESGDNETAAKHYLKAAQLNPEYPDVHYNLGLVYRRLKRYDDAVASLQAALKLDPTHFQAISEIGSCFSDQSNFDEAINHYKKAETIQPKSAELQNNLGVALTRAGQLFEAKKHLEKAIRLNTSFAEAQNNLAVLQSQLGNHNQAVESLAEVVRQKPDDYNALRNYGQTLNAVGDFERSVEMLRKAVAVRPDGYEGWLDLAVALTQLQCDEEAHQAFVRAHELNVEAIAPRWGIAMTRLKSFYETDAEIEDSFSKYEMEIDSLSELIRSDLRAHAAEAAEAMRFLTPFYLILHDRNFKSVQAKLGSLACEIMAQQYPNKAAPSELSKGRVRVGIVSHHFNNHTVWKCITRGWAKQLDRTMFELTAYSTGGPQDASTAEAKSLFDHFVEIRDFEAMSERIIADKQDILLYPGLGLESHTYKLAAMKLAPIQCASYGHPITLGLPTIDRYFVSELLEPENADAHYSEAISRLPGLGSSYEPSGTKPNQTGLAGLGVRADAKLFLCLQHLHKYLPRYDELLPRIAKRVPNAQFLFGRKNSRLAPLLMKRLEKAFDRFDLKASDYVTFLPEVSHDTYFGLCQVGHVFMDTPLNSGLMTTLEALETGIVPVTMPGDYMRSMQTARLLSAVGVEETVVDSMDDYVDVAVRLATDDEWRDHLRGRIKENVHRLYGQKDGVAALEKSLLQMMAK
jgi:predicted O-linked N-acetylglucosamine transferase (SPINDLY family)